MKIKESELRKFIKSMLLNEHFLENENIQSENLEEHEISEEVEEEYGEAPDPFARLEIF